MIRAGGFLFGDLWRETGLFYPLRQEKSASLVQLDTISSSSGAKDRTGPAVSSGQAGAVGQGLTQTLQLPHAEKLVEAVGSQPSVDSRSNSLR